MATTGGPERGDVDLRRLWVILVDRVTPRVTVTYEAGRWRVRVRGSDIHGVAVSWEGAVVDAVAQWRALARDINPDWPTSTWEVAQLGRLCSDAELRALIDAAT